MFYVVNTVCSLVALGLYATALVTLTCLYG